jgi:MoaA/NifB/PqqE/SkfB family radical SAM enzyme
MFRNDDKEDGRMENKSMMETIQSFAVKQALKYVQKEPEKNLPKLLDWADRFDQDGLFASQRQAIRNVLEHPESNWYQLMLKVFQLDDGMRRAFFENFILHASLLGRAKKEKIRKQEHCNVPWAILLDPTSACNLHCTGCWAAEYGHNLNLDFETIDRIIRQGKELGIYMYIYTGGEPMVRKADLIRLCEKHADCTFLAFTNGTLIDEDFCQEMLRVKNFIPAISLEGFEQANDSRRGLGAFQNVQKAMERLRAHKLPFGISTCYTSANYNDISSEAYFDMIIEAGALFVWFFHYMPVGNNAALELLPTPEQRKVVYTRIRNFRKTKPIFSMDFQNDAEYVGGCIAGGRSYLHINAAGDVEPCVFIHYSNVNIHYCSLLEALKSPLFMAYHDRQPFNQNMLQPCPMLENPECLRDMVKKTGAKSTDLQSPESVDHLCDKCQPYAKNWAKTAACLWRESRKPSLGGITMCVETTSPMR